MEIWERIFELLGENKNRQRELSRATGISTKTISAWKQRKSDPSAKSISAIAEFLNVSISYLLTGKDEISFKLSRDEEDLIRDYRKLDFKGKSEIGHTLYKELERMNQDGDMDISEA